MLCYSHRYEAALQLASEAFRGRTRKASEVPYISHLLSVSALVWEHGGDEDQAIAALLHDYLEDIQGADVDAIRDRFGDRVTDMVVTLTDTTAFPKPPWAPRKVAYVHALASADPATKLVGAADKLHNARSIRRDLLLMGPAAWTKFSATPAQSRWYYRACVEALGSEGWRSSLLTLLRDEVASLHRLSGVAVRDGALRDGPPPS